jgi:hypothetical protein
MNTMSYFVSSDLIQQPPVLRAAYSDRTAWILAELSRLVYEKLPVEIQVDEFVKEIITAAGSSKGPELVRELVIRSQQRGNQVPSEFESILSKAGIELIESYSTRDLLADSQAILVRLGTDESPVSHRMLILAFRGTEVKKISDVASDLLVNLVDAPGGGRVHKGFLHAFQLLEDSLKKTLNKYPDMPLYITGHSLGGALALLATRYLGYNSTGACYTFGSPRAADDLFYEQVKTPIYRVVNASDGVARIPLGYSLMLIINLIQLIPFNGTTWIARWLRRQVLGYCHPGSLVYLSDTLNIEDANGIPYAGLRVELSPDPAWQLLNVAQRFVSSGGKSVVQDHRISIYASKLLANARRRNR